MKQWEEPKMEIIRWEDIFRRDKTMNWHELLSDIAIIPAWECFLTGFSTGSLLWFGIWLRERKKK